MPNRRPKANRFVITLIQTKIVQYKRRYNETSLNAWKRLSKNKNFLTLMKQFYRGYKNKDHYLNKILFVISVLSYPIIDFTRVIFIRLYSGVSPFMADKRHIHHIIQKKTTKHYKIVAIIISAQIALMLIIQGLFNFII